MSKHGRAVLPKSFMVRVRTLPDGSKRSPRKVEWLLRFLETGDGSRAVIEAGYDTAWPATLSARFAAEFQDLITEAYFIRKSMDLMLAAEVGRKIMTRSDYQPVKDPTTGEMLIGPDGKPVLRVDAKLEANALKAAQWVESQGPLPPGVAIKGGLPDGGERERGGKDQWKRDLEALAGRLGFEVLMQLPEVRQRADYRDFVKQLPQYPVKVVNEVLEVTQAATEANGSAQAAVQSSD